MICLALDTSGPLCQVALARKGQSDIVHETLDLSTGHAEHIFGLIDKVLKRARVEKDQLDRLAVIVGPGSFTGLRVGIAAAKGLGLALGCPAIGVSTLQLALWGVPVHSGESWVMLDARRGQYYVQGFAESAPLGAAQLVDEVRIHELITPTARIITDNLGAISPIVAQMKRDAQIEAENIIQAHLDCSVLAQCAMDLNQQDWLAEPLYVRPPDAKKQGHFAVKRQTETPSG